MRYVITDIVYSLTYKKRLTLDNIISILEANIYFNNEYKDFIIDEPFNTNLPLYDTELLDYRDFLDYCYSFKIDEKMYYKVSNLIEIFDKKIDKCCIYDISIERVGKNYVLDLHNRGNVAELRYLDLVKLREKE